MKGYWVYIAFSVLFSLSGVMLYDFVFGLIFLIYIIWIYIKLPRKIFYISVLMSILFILDYEIVKSTNKTAISPKETAFYGNISSIPDINGRTLSFHFKTPLEKILVVYKIPSSKTKKELQLLRVGMSCQLSGRLTIPPAKRNHASFDYYQYLHQQRIHWILKPADLSVKNCNTTNEKYAYMLLSWREKGLRYIQERIQPPAFSMVQALVYGETANIDEETMDHYRAAGLLHLLAISGLHVGFLTGLLFYLFIRIGITRERAAVSLVLILPLYAVIAGAAPSVVRAVLMAILVLTPSVIRKAALNPVDCISLTFLVMTGIHPYFLSQAGFQLSFIVSFSLILSSKLIMERNSFHSQLFSANIVAQLSSLPLILYHFHQISIVSLPLNLVFIPFFSIVILPLCLITLLTSCLFPFIMTIIVVPLNLLLQTSSQLVGAFVSLPYSKVVLGQPPLYIVLSLYTAICYLFAWQEKRAKILIPCLCTGAILLYQYCSFSLNPSGRVTFIDVGQGDSILIELPYRKSVYLIDTGGQVPFEREKWQKKRSEFEVGKDVVLPFLYARGIRKIDKLILTHGDYDHAGGALSILDEVKVKELILSKNESFNTLETKIIEAAVQRKVKITVAQAGDNWTEGNCFFYITFPIENEKEENNQSLVLFSSLGAYKWLFTGDLGIEGEEKVVQAFPALKADVLKVGHHGSKTSTSTLFLQHLNPKIAIISAGENNRYNHPHPDVLDKLTKHGITILRTDRLGAITYTFRENSGTFSWEIP